MFEITNTFTSLFDDLCSGFVLVLIGFVVFGCVKAYIETRKET